MFPKPTRMETNYLKRCFGNHLAQALAEVAMVQPSDPIEYLAHRLYHYRKTAKAKEQVHAVSLGRAVSFLIVTQNPKQDSGDPWGGSMPLGTDQTLLCPVTPG